MNESFLMLARRIFGHHFWLETRTFSRAEAWLDLLQTAAYAPHKRMISGHIMEIPRGGLVASVRWLSDRWKWSNTKVCLFLDVLEEENMITREKRHGNTLLSICKYDAYNTPHDTETTGKRRKDDTEATAGRQRDDAIEEGKERKGSLPLRDLCQGLEIPPWEHVREFARTIGLAEWKARDAFDRLESTGWRDKGEAIQKWKPYFTRVKTWWEADGRPSGPNGQNGKPAPKQSKFAFQQPLYNDDGLMIRDAYGRDLDPTTGKIL